eukprot:TRINITY_DN7554_c0_g1_i2.p2 TRINITY_DN7554_c0_g1~~TRINITY_DN7554_c0_g1_i2.p2  ORF type:complete len:221 (+),score=32.93 TRINITY_DN7554_c0_g1_i2:58-720(+)
MEMSDVSTLPSEILLQVFSYFSPEELKTLRIVCRSWKDIGDESSLWIRFFAEELSAVILHGIQCCFPPTKSWSDAYFDFRKLGGRQRKQRVCPFCDVDLLVGSYVATCRRCPFEVTATECMSCMRFVFHDWSSCHSCAEPLCSVCHRTCADYGVLLCRLCSRTDTGYSTQPKYLCRHCGKACQRCGKVYKLADMRALDRLHLCPPCFALADAEQPREDPA